LDILTKAIPLVIKISTRSSSGERYLSFLFLLRAVLCTSLALILFLPLSCLHSEN
jgi:hypothetical protein